MAGDNFQFLSRLAVKLGTAGGYIAVGRAVEAILPDTVLLVILVWNGIEVRLLRHGLVERRVKHRHLRDAGHNLLAGADAHEVCRVMKGSKRNARFNRRLNFRGDDHTSGEFGTAVKYAVADSIHHSHIRNHAVLAVCQFLQDVFDGDGMVRHLHIAFKHDLTGNGVAHMPAESDTFANALCQDLMIVHIKKLILER